MKRIFLFLLSEQRVVNLVRRQQLALIPPEFRKKGSIGSTGFEMDRVVAELIHGVDATARQKSLNVVIRRHLEDMTSADENQLVGIVYQRKLQDVVQPLMLTYSCAPAPENGEVTMGGIQETIGLMIRRLQVILLKFREQKFRVPMLLPNGFFSSTSLDELHALLRGQQDVRDTTLATLLDQRLSRLVRDHRKPSRKKGGHSGGESRYVDSNGYSFSYGHENHGPPDTLVPPHNVSCQLASRKRCGLSYDYLRHFNVTKGDNGVTIKGINCHHEVSAARSTSHLNIFPNNHLREE